MQGCDTDASSLLEGWDKRNLLELHNSSIRVAMNPPALEGQRPDSPEPKKEALEAPQVKEEEKIPLAKPKEELLKSLLRYRQLGAASNKLSYTRVRGTEGFNEDTERLLPGKKKPGKKYYPPGQLTVGQLNSISDRERALLRGLDMEYSKLLSRELEAKRIRANALRKIVFSQKKESKGLSGGHDDQGVGKKDKKKKSKPGANGGGALQDEIDASLLDTANILAQDSPFSKQKSQKVHSTQILVLKSKILALNSSIEGVSYAVKGGLFNLPSVPLNYAFAARHLQRYIDHLKEARQTVTQQIESLEADVAFERRLVAELKLVRGVVKSRSTDLLKNEVFLNSSLSTSNWISRHIMKRHQIAEEEANRLMACLKYLIEFHLAPYLCLYAHQVPAFEDLTGPRTKNQKKDALSISNQLQAAPDNDLSDVGAVSARIQALLVSLLNNSLNSTPSQILCTELKTLTDPIVRMLFSCHVIVHPFSNAYVICLRDFGKSAKDLQ